MSEREKLRMLCGSFYIPKEGGGRSPEGEDAHFICTEKQTIGVADGVGGWAKEGVDAGIYARELMSNAEAAMVEEPSEGRVDPTRVLNRAHSKTKAKGSSTACIITLDSNRLDVVNVGDSGFVLIRKGAETYQSPIQQYSFNFPYQLENNVNLSPEIGQVLTVPVQAGDVIVAGTDGLLDNLFVSQIEEVVRKAIEQGSDPPDIAWAVAQHAYYCSMDQNAITPFVQASINAGHNHSGGKPDDITVIVCCITGASGCV